jgi:hypothetical protein
MDPQRQLTFNDDGTLDAAQLEGLPQDFIDRVTAPEFVAQARKQIAAKRIADHLASLPPPKVKTGRRESRRSVPLKPCLAIPRTAQDIARRPAELSGRQRKRLRRAVRSAMKAERGRLQNEVQIGGGNQA